jgi:hypothetical protein
LRLAKEDHVVIVAAGVSLLLLLSPLSRVAILFCHIHSLGVQHLNRVINYDL